MGTKWRTTIYELSPEWKTAVAATLSWYFCQWFGSARPYFAPIAVIISMQATVEDSMWWGFQRVVGMIVGIVLAAWSERLMGIHGWSIGLVILVGTLAVKSLRLGRQAVTQGSISTMLVWIMGIGHHGYAKDRVLDTLIGVVTAVLCHIFILPPDFTPQAKSAIEEAAQKLADRFTVTGEWLIRGASLDEVDTISEETDDYLSRLHMAWKELQQASHALRYSPLVRHRRTRLAAYESDYACVREGYEHMTSMFRTACDWKRSGTWDPDEAGRWGEMMKDMAVYLKEWGRVSFHRDMDGAGEVLSEPWSASKWIGEAPLASSEFQAALRNEVAQFRHRFVIE